MRLLVLCPILALGCACEKQAPQRKDFLARIEEGKIGPADLAVLLSYSPGMSSACIEKVQAAGVEAMPRGTEDCFIMTPKERWTGLWRARFEGSEFCADKPGRPASECGDSEHATWFEPSFDYEPNNALYRVEFVGRRTAVPGHYGHFGQYEHEMVVDDLISIKEVELPPKEPVAVEASRSTH